MPMTKPMTGMVQNAPVLHATSYDRTSVQDGILHIGVGAFHRAHQAVYIDEYMDKTGDTSWGIVGVNMLPATSDVAEILDQNDGVYTLKTMSPEGDAFYQQIRAVMRVIDWTKDTKAVLEAFAQNSIKLVTITVTESGYYLDETAHLDEADARIAHDLGGDIAQTIYGLLYQGLKARIAEGGAPITVQTCDNIRKNGDVLAQCFKRFLVLMGDQSVHDWVEKNVAFPNSMVDRITPRAPLALDDEMARLFLKPVSDHHPRQSVLCESFKQWVVERKFATTYPDIAVAGVQIVADVHPYEEAKIRILNGGHTAIAYLGVLRGFTTYDEAISDAELSAFFDEFQMNEVLPGLPVPTPVDLKTYYETTKARFLNKHISDTLERICMDGATKFPIFIMPTVRASFARGEVPLKSLEAIASWYVFMRKILVGSLDLNCGEPKWDKMVPLLAEGQEASFASDEALWGDTPRKHPEFVQILLTLIQKTDARFTSNKLGQE